MKVLMYGHKHFPLREGGVEVVLLHLAPEIVKLGNEVTLYNRKEPGVQNAVHVYGVEVKNAPTLRNKKLNAIVASFTAAVKTAFAKGDIVHVHAEGMAGFIWIPKLFGKKVVVTIHGINWQLSKWEGFASKYMRYAEGVAVRHADRIITLTAEDAKYFRETYGIETVTVPNGVSVPVEPLKEISDKYLAKNKIRPNDYILYIGRISPEKNLDAFLKAYKESGSTQQVVIAGALDSDYAEELMVMNQNENIRFVGFADEQDCGILYHSAAAYILPSKKEGMSIALLEAASLGVPLILRDIPNNRVVAGDDATYFTDDSELVGILAKHFEGRNTEAAAKVVQKYNWSRVAKQTVKIYRSCLGKKAQRKSNPAV